MYKVPLPELKERIIASGKLDSPQLEQRIKAKINELSGLISEEGAAHIIANELGIEVVPQNKSKLKIKEIYPGMRGISSVGKVVKKFEIREFKKGDSIGKVGSLVLGDETGTIRTVFWNDQVLNLKNIQENDVLLVKDVSVKENMNGKELHLGDRSSLVINPEGEQVNNVRQGTMQERKSIQELQGGEERIELLGTVVQVFNPTFFQVCPQCSKRVNDAAGQFQCSTHGAVTPSSSYVLNAVVEDGTGSIRCVFWKNQTLHLLMKNDEEMVGYRDSPSKFEDVKTDLLGEQFKMIGRIQKNEMFQRLEFVALIVEKAKPEEELLRLEGK